MPRMREAIRSGWKTSKSSSFSPLDANMIGLPVTVAIDSAAPPRASPSSLVSTTPSKPTPLEERLGGDDGVLADHRVDDEAGSRRGRTASRMSAACFISSASIASRPAVSTMTTSWTLGRSRARRRPATPRTGSPTPLPGSGAKTGTPARSPTTWSWSTALGRCRSAATSSGVWPCSRSQRASLPASVVLPAPCRPASRIDRRRGLGEAEPAGLAAEDPDELLVDDLDDLLRGVERLRDLGAERPLLDRARRTSRTTGSATSASSRAIRISARSRRCRPRTGGPCRAGS